MPRRNPNSPLRLLGAAGFLFSLVSCYSQADYAEDYTQAICDKMFECLDESVAEYFQYADEDECVDDRADSTQVEYDDCVFSPADARACVEETEALACDEYERGRWPTSCDLVCGEPS